ncbi:MAG: hypothetical protein AB7H66_02040 [Hyphomonadaceae bacterium]
MAAGAYRAHDAGHPGGPAVVLDADLLSFIRSEIRSTWTLELLLLVRKDAARSFTEEELVRELRSTGALIGRGIRELQAAKLVECRDGGRCRYAPAAPELDQMCARLERAYAERPVAVVNAIIQSPTERRQSFADAFRFTKKED